MPWIEIFRAGKYPQGTFTQSDIQPIVQQDDSQFPEVPVVNGGSCIWMDRGLVEERNLNIIQDRKTWDEEEHQ